MPVPRSSLAAVALGGRLYAVGGFGGPPGQPERALASLEVYDPGRDAWETRAPMSAPRTALAAAELDGRLWAIGGFGPDAEAVSTVERYDPVRDTWEVLAPMPTARGLLGAAVLGGRIYAAGGRARLQGRPYQAVSILERYDPDPNPNLPGTWTPGLAPMPTRRDGLAVVELAGQLHAIGGFGPSRLFPNGQMFRDVEVYDPQTDIWCVAPPTRVPRFVFTTAKVGHRTSFLVGVDHTGRPRYREAFVNLLYVVGGTAPGAVIVEVYPEVPPPAPVAPR